MLPTALTRTSSFTAEMRLAFTSRWLVMMSASAKRRVFVARIVCPFSDAPFPRAAENVSPVTGFWMTPTIGCPSSTRAMEIENSGMPG